MCTAPKLRAASAIEERHNAPFQFGAVCAGLGLIGAFSRRSTEVSDKQAFPRTSKSSEETVLDRYWI